MNNSQVEFVHEYINCHAAITSRDATTHGITRLAARIDDLKRRGVSIESRWIKVPTRWADKQTKVKEYYLDNRAA